ncbi:MAG: LysM peptidoglycan-binding domain-containing protein [Gammaproteobacteria bacterium]
MIRSSYVALLRRSPHVKPAGCDPETGVMMAALFILTTLIWSFAVQQGSTTSPSQNLFLWLALAVLLMLGGCRSDEVQPLTACEQNPASQECLCLNDEQSEACACATDANSRACLCYGSEVRGEVETQACFCTRNPDHSICRVDTCPASDLKTMIDSMLELVDKGQWYAAEDLSNCAVAAYPDDSRASNIQQQLDLGGNYFTDTRNIEYTVQPGDSLARIAKRCLPSKNPDDFIALARYNSIEVPRNLKHGTKIQLPGSQPCEDADQLAQDAQKQLETGNLVRAHKLASRAFQISRSKDHKMLLDKISEALVKSLHTKAESQLEQENCSDAQRTWTDILKIEPNDEQAKFLLRDVKC